MMKTVVIFTCVLMLVNGQVVEWEKQLTKAIDKLISDEILKPGKCLNQLNLMAQDIQNNDQNYSSWGKQMISSWSVIPQQIKYGNSYDFGNFELCMTLNHPLDLETITGQYCLFQFYSKSNETIPVEPIYSFLNNKWKNIDRRFGAAICVPSACDPEVVTKFVGNLLTESDFEVAQDYEQKSFCKTNESSQKINFRLIFLLTLSMILLVLVVASSVYDLKTRNNDIKLRNQWLIAFSIIKNGSSLINCDDNLRKDIKILHFIRVFASISILFLHSSFFYVMYPTSGPLKMKFSEKIVKIIVCFQSYVETFFTLSGLLTTKSMLSDLERGQFSIFKTLFRRYMRLTPSLAFIMLIFAVLIDFLSRNAPYAIYDVLVKPCDVYWWSVLLHTQVQTNPENLCMQTTWYFPVDWQMFVFSVCLIYFGRKIKFNKFYLVLSAISVFSIGFGYFTSLENKFLLEQISMTNYDINYFISMYVQPQYRGVSFVVGVILGFIMNSFNSRKLSFFSSIASVSAFFIINFMIGYLYLTDFFFGKSFELNSIFLAFFRPLTAISFAFLIFGVHFNTSNNIETFLSQKVWLILSKLSFCLYLVHPVLQTSLIVYSKTPSEFGFSIGKMFVRDFGLSIFIAVFLHLFVEAPFTEIGKIVSNNLSPSMKIKK